MTRRQKTPSASHVVPCGFNLSRLDAPKKLTSWFQLLAFSCSKTYPTNFGSHSTLVSVTWTTLTCLAAGFRSRCLTEVWWARRSVRWWVCSSRESSWGTASSSTTRGAFLDSQTVSLRSSKIFLHCNSVYARKSCMFLKRVSYSYFMAVIIGLI